MKKNILQPMIADESVIIQFTDTVVTAYVFADEKHSSASSRVRKKGVKSCNEARN